MTPNSQDDPEAQMLLAPASKQRSSDINEGKSLLSKEQVRKSRNHLGIGYMMAMGVCGIVLTAIGSTLDDIAENCGTVSMAIGSVFIARGVGAILGAISCAKLFAPPARGNSLIVAALVFLVCLLMYLPFVKSVFVLHLLFGGLGFSTAVTDTGCQIMSRKVHGVKAGPWLGANTVVFGVAGALVPVVDVITANLLAMFICISSIAAITSVVILIAPHPENPTLRSSLPQRLSKSIGGSKGIAPWVSKYYVTEILLGNIIFWLIGGKVLCSSYIEDYVVSSGVINTDNKAWALMAVWVAIAFGRFTGLWDQIQLNAMGPVAIHALYSHLAFWISGGLLGGIIWLVFPKSAVAFFIAICLYGFGNGPCVGYCYDLNNRLTQASETGMSIVMLGLNSGASMVPFAATTTWEHTPLSYHAVPIFVAVSMALPLPLLYLTRPVNCIADIGENSEANAVLIEKKIVGVEH